MPKICKFRSRQGIISEFCGFLRKQFSCNTASSTLPKIQKNQQRFCREFFVPSWYYESTPTRTRGSRASRPTTASLSAHTRPLARRQGSFEATRAALGKLQLQTLRGCPPRCARHEWH